MKVARHAVEVHEVEARRRRALREPLAGGRAPGGVGSRRGDTAGGVRGRGTADRRARRRQAQEPRDDGRPGRLSERHECRTHVGRSGIHGPGSRWWKSPLHSSSDASRRTALFVGYILDMRPPHALSGGRLGPLPTPSGRAATWGSTTDCRGRLSHRRRDACNQAAGRGGWIAGRGENAPAAAPTADAGRRSCNMRAQEAT